MKKFIKSTLALVCICSVMAILIALTNAITAPLIKEKQEASANQALLELIPDGEGFEKMDISAYTLPSTVTEVYKEKNGGYVVTLTTTGYGSGMVIMCGIRADGTVSGVICLASTETLGYEKSYGENFIGKDMAGVEAVDTISGATKTTAGYKNAIKDALNAVTILKGGSVDIRTEEEIFNDKLAEALPAGEGKFTKMFITEVIVGIDSVYAADNGKGWVYIIGESFIPVDENGNTDDATVATAHGILSASVAESIDLTGYENLPRNLVSAMKTATGNYILEVKGAGYGIKGGDEYHPASGEYIVVRVSMTADGKIIDTFTVSQQETKNLGDACADEKFYGQFDGKTESDYKSVDAIAGATLTTNGYLKAIEDAFASVKVLEGKVLEGGAN